MNKFDFFRAVIRNSEAHRSVVWVTTALSLVKQDQARIEKGLNPYDIVQMPNGFYFFDAQTAGLVKIEDAPPGQPLFTFKDQLDLKAGDVLNLDQDIRTTVGNALFNLLCLVKPFGKKIPYQNKFIDPKELGNFIVSKLKDTPKPGETRDENVFYVDEMIQCVDAIFNLTNFSQLCTWSFTPKVMLPPPGLAEFKKKLIEENKGRLHDASVIAKIAAQLVKFDAEYLKGDPGENFLIDKKSRNIVRMKQFLMYGAEPGLDDSISLDLIENSLLEGWDIEKIPSMLNAQRAGSFNRGAQTELGGVAVKWLQRASSNLTVTIDDCGANLGHRTYVTKDKVEALVGRSIAQQDGSTPIVTIEDANSYLGKFISVRSPQYCLLDKTDYCKTCIGTKLSINPTGLALAVSKMGSTFLAIFMAAAHAKALILSELDLETDLM